MLCEIGSRISEAKQLKTASATAWDEKRCTLKDIRYQKEVLTLCTVVNLLNSDRTAEALAVISQRILSTQAVKAT